MAALIHLLLAMSDQRRTTTERLRELLLSEQVMRTLYEAPVQLPSHLVYFARTASLIEGLGMRYDPYFNPIAFASPVVLRLRRRIVASLHGDAVPASDDWARTLGALVGDVAVVVERAGREIAAIVGTRLLGTRLFPARRSGAGMPHEERSAAALTGDVSGDVTGDATPPRLARVLL